MSDIEGVIVRKVRGPYKKRNLGAHLSASERLARMGWDPLGEMVQVQRKILAELDRQEARRDNTIVELTSSGKVRYYNEETHYALFDKLIAISDKLMRYSYKRVSEAETKEEAPLLPLIVNLSQDGDQYVIGGDDSPAPSGDEIDIDLDVSGDDSPLKGEYEFDPYVEASDAYHEEQTVKKSTKLTPPSSLGAPSFTRTLEE